MDGISPAGRLGEPSLPQEGLPDELRSQGDGELPQPEVSPLPLPCTSAVVSGRGHDAAALGHPDGFAEEGAEIGGESADGGELGKIEEVDPAAIGEDKVKLLAGTAFAVEWLGGEKLEGVDAIERGEVAEGGIIRVPLETSAALEAAAVFVEDDPLQAFPVVEREATEVKGGDDTGH